MNLNKQLVSVLFTAFLLTSCNSLPKVTVSWDDNQTEEQAQEEIANETFSTQIKESRAKKKTKKKLASQPIYLATKEDIKPTNDSPITKKSADNIIANKEDATDKNSGIQEGQIAEASVNQKYSNLAQVLNCPGDRSTYGTFHDYGYWDGGSWCGHQAKAGYWVWVDPNWYIWQTVATNEQQPQTTPEPNLTETSTEPNLDIQEGQFVNNGFDNQLKVELLNVKRIKNAESGQAGKTVVVKLRVKRLVEDCDDSNTPTCHINFSNSKARNVDTYEEYEVIGNKRTHSSAIYSLPLNAWAEAYFWLEVPTGVEVIDIVFPYTEIFKNVPIEG